MTAFDHSITEVESINGMRIDCRYLMSPNYIPATNVCRSLHWLFLLYAPDRTHPNGYLLRSGIEHFLDYMAMHNLANPEPLQIKKYTDINAEVFSGFVNYIRDKNIPVACAEKLKAAMTVVPKDTGKLPLIALPIVAMDRKNGTPPLNSDGFESFELAITTHIIAVFKKLMFRAQVEKAEPYDAATVMEEVRPTPTKEWLFKWQKNEFKKKKRANKESYHSRFRKCLDPEIKALTDDPKGISKFIEIYHRDNPNAGAPKKTQEDQEAQQEQKEQEEASVEGKGFANWKVDYARIVKTFIVHGFPFKFSSDELYNKYRQATVTTVPEDCDDIIAILLHRLTWANRSTNGAQLLKFDEVLGLYYPTITDMTAVLMFMMFQSGWNKETALALDQDNFEHLLTGTIEEAIKVVFSEKHRSQGAGKPFDAPKRINMPTRNDDPFSFYNLIQLAVELSSPLADYPFDVISVLAPEERMNPMFLCIRPWGEWVKGGRHTSIAHPKTFPVGVQQFLKQYEVIDDGKRLTSAIELTRRFRPTWLLYKKKHHPITLLSMTMGHKDRETTDIFYDSSSAAHYERLKRLRSELEEVVKLLRTRQFKGLLGKQAQAEASANLKIFHIPGKPRALWGCANQTKPDWVGSDIIVSTGRKCFAIKECIFCSQFRVFEDSLPFLMERASHLEELLGDAEESGFSSRLSKELEVLQFILDEWGDENEITTAARYRRRESPLLPRDLNILEIIFESEEYNV
ncbi:hypothetical protein [Pseudomonas vancouverensis]|uniref:Integrase n=1 Tax=Pseudomonas vancouverensis TaxID=95300 RepID=A0A1H2MEE8_PSEVA|nr:hypothetical protein [Pseudomonas vancouverensis]KAB0490563.1 hypothetical protein F7R09_26795 [Pseudomonas vancouverensis]TDB62826.1 hypothetical protein EIY72_13105 [Pseudomonas vancouverensis]SDU91657.1 hypothetical protein SAMN05216558_0654 [Pseudomonas vancouverensis]